MYSIVRKRNGQFLVCCRIQDGTERQTYQSERKAVEALIGMARIYNHAYIRADDIEWYDEPETVQAVVSADDRELLDKIHRKELVVLPHNDPRVAYRLTDGECDLIIKIREGEVDAVQRRGDAAGESHNGNENQDGTRTPG